MKVTLIFLTFNRKDAVEKSLSYNLEVAGYPFYELIHVDNGSESGFADWFEKTFHPAIQIRHRENLGVSRGYNRGLLLATGELVCITGVDRLMPENWLAHLLQHFKDVPNTGVISIYLPPVDDHAQTRYYGEPLVINGRVLQPSRAVGARIMRREFFLSCGFFREDFPVYGYEDHEWMSRAKRVADEQGRINYIVPDLWAEHCHGDDYHFKMPSGQTYHEFKQSFLTEENRKGLIDAHLQGYPYYNPYARIEPPLDFDVSNGPGRDGVRSQAPRRARV